MFYIMEAPILSTKIIQDMKGILITALLAFGIGTTTATFAQDHTYYHQYSTGGHIIMRDNDPEAIATNKTVILEKQAGGLTRQQEKKVYKLYKKEAKQEVKLRTVKQENREAMKDILTKEQYAKMLAYRQKDRDERQYSGTDHSGRTLHMQKAPHTRKTMHTHKKARKGKAYSNSAKCDKACCNRK